jgi:hypothetical protein
LAPASWSVVATRLVGNGRKTIVSAQASSNHINTVLWFTTPLTIRC